MLLRNSDDLLPLDAQTLSSIAVIGPLADSKRDTVGPWVFDFDLDETVTVLEGIQRKVGDGAQVKYAPASTCTNYSPPTTAMGRVLHPEPPQSSGPSNSVPFPRVPQVFSPQQ